MPDKCLYDLLDTTVAEPCEEPPVINSNISQNTVTFHYPLCRKHYWKMIYAVKFTLSDPNTLLNPNLYTSSISKEMWETLDTELRKKI